MSLNEFLNGIRVLWNVGADEYLSCINPEDRGYFSDEVLWRRFATEPHRTFANLPDQDQERIFALIQRRNEKAGIASDRCAELKRECGEAKITIIRLWEAMEYVQVWLEGAKAGGIAGASDLLSAVDSVLKVSDIDGESVL